MLTAEQFMYPRTIANISFLGIDQHASNSTRATCSGISARISREQVVSDRSQRGLDHAHVVPANL